MKVNNPVEHMAVMFMTKRLISGKQGFTFKGNGYNVVQADSEILQQFYTKLNSRPISNFEICLLIAVETELCKRFMKI